MRHLRYECTNNPTQKCPYCVFVSKLHCNLLKHIYRIHPDKAKNFQRATTTRQLTHHGSDNLSITSAPAATVNTTSVNKTL